MKVILSLSFIELAFGLFLVHPQYWNYDKLNWDFPFCRNGSAQSPINILSNVTVPLPADKQIPRFFNVRTKGFVTVWNDGRTLTFKDFESWPRESRPYFTDETGKKFLLFRMHLHWPSKIANRKGYHFGHGNEHAIDGKRHTGEIHLAYRFDDDNLDLAEALKSSNIRMVAVFFDIKTRRDNVPFALTEVDLVLDDLVLYDNMALNVPFSVASIVEKTTKGGMYIYNGSLTTPDCTEGIRWYIAKHPVALGIYQIHKLQALQFTEQRGDSRSNARSYQKLNNRTIYYVKDE